MDGRRKTETKKSIKSSSPLAEKTFLGFSNSLPIAIMFPLLHPLKVLGNFDVRVGMLS